MTTARRPAVRKARTGAPTDRRERLLRSAHELLAERGLAGFKVLDVAARAEANVALINYHFGGREGLLDEVIRQTGAGVGQQRLERLERLLATCAPKSPDPEAVVRCWLDPMFESVTRADDRGVFKAMVHLMFAADVSQERKAALLSGVLGVTGRFLDVLEQCLPRIERTALTWRMLCAIGSCYLVLSQPEPIGWPQLAAAGSRPRRASGEAAYEELITFIVAGFSAAPVAAKVSGKAKLKKAG